MNPIYVPSTAVGKVWCISAYKPTRGAVRIVAQEGTEGHADGFSYFTFVLFGSRRFAVDLTGRNTAKHRSAALARLMQDMVAQQFVTPADAAKVTL